MNEDQHKNEPLPKKQIYENIERDVIQLRETMLTLHEIIDEQQNSIDSIEDAIRQSKEDIISSESVLQDSNSYSWNTSWYNYIIAGGISAIYLLFL